MYNTIKKINKDIGICISTFLRDDALLKLVQSIETYLPEFKMYIVDQGIHNIEKDKLYSRLVRAGHVIKYIKYDSGISKTRRILKEICREKFLVYMEDDFQATEQTNLYKLKEILDENPDIGIVGGNLTGYATTGAYSFFLNRADNIICYFPLDYLIEKNLNSWEYTSKGTKFLRADIVSDFTMWRKDVPSIFDDNVKTIEHTDVYLLIKTKTKYKVGFCPETQINHVHNSKNSTYNALRNRKKELEYLKNYWNVSNFFTFDKYMLYKLEKTINIPATVPYLPLDINKSINTVNPSRCIFTTQQKNIVQTIKKLNANNIKFWLLKETCLEVILKKDILSDKFCIGVNSDNDKNKILSECTNNNVIFDIQVENRRSTKTAKIYGLVVDVPIPVVAYLETTFNKTWNTLKNE